MSTREKNGGALDYLGLEYSSKFDESTVRRLSEHNNYSISKFTDQNIFRQKIKIPKSTNNCDIILKQIISSHL